jgi:hypothetical protein
MIIFVQTNAKLRLMKVLMIYSREFSYKPTIKTLPDFPDAEGEKSFFDVQVVCIQVEAEDTEKMKSVETKLVKLIKWAAKKNGTKNILLHSFAHLSESKAPPGISKELFDKVEERLKKSEFSVEQTPYGYFLDLKLDAPGKSSARIFKNL